jgi:hypothetical protein
VKPLHTNSFKCHTYLFFFESKSTNSWNRITLTRCFHLFITIFLCSIGRFLNTFGRGINELYHIILNLFNSHQHLQYLWISILTMIFLVIAIFIRDVSIYFDVKIAIILWFYSELKQIELFEFIITTTKKALTAIFWKPLRGGHFLLTKAVIETVLVNLLTEVVTIKMLTSVNIN